LYIVKNQNKMKFWNISLTFLIIWIVWGCSPKDQGGSPEQKAESDTEKNPAMEGFNEDASDQKAIEIADDVMEAMGGREAWEDTRYLAWNFFGARDLIWDRQTGDVRIESPGDSMIYIVNIHSMEGKVANNGVPITNEDTLQKYLKKARDMWINDSYWLVMPFKLKDTGVTLSYLGQDTTLKGNEAHVLQLEFKDVGVTPQNKYNVYVDPETDLVAQWAYFKSADQDTATAVWPWDNYQQYGDILLSGDRSDDKGPKNIKLPDTLPDDIFSSLEPVDWTKI